MVSGEVRERQIPYDFSYMWSLNNRLNKQNRNKLTDTENKLVVVRWEESGGWWGEV